MSNSKGWVTPENIKILILFWIALMLTILVINGLDAHIFYGR